MTTKQTLSTEQDDETWKAPEKASESKTTFKIIFIFKPKYCKNQKLPSSTVEDNRFHQKS